MILEIGFLLTDAYLYHRANLHHRQTTPWVSSLQFSQSSILLTPLQLGTQEGNRRDERSWAVRGLLPKVLIFRLVIGRGQKRKDQEIKCFLGKAGNTHQIRHCRHIRLEDVKAVCNGVGYWPCGRKEKYKAHFLGKDILVPCKTAEAENAKHGFRLCERERQTSWFAANELWVRSDDEINNLHFQGSSFIYFSRGVDDKKQPLFPSLRQLQYHRNRPVVNLA